MSATAPILAFDIGGTSIGAALVSPRGEIIVHDHAPTPPLGEPMPLLAAIESLTASLMTKIPADTAIHKAAGVAVPGVLDRALGKVLRAVNLPRLEGFDLRERIAERLRNFVRVVEIDTDVVAAGWAQWRSRRSGDAPANVLRPGRFVYLSLGTGVGGAAILDGWPQRHTRSGAGHLGHLIVETGPDAATCKCGARGCLEAELTAALRIDDEAAAAARVALGLLQIAHLYAPDRITLGGGVVDHRPHLVELVRTAFQPLRSTLTPADLQIDRATLSSKDAGVIGAALLAAQHDPDRVIPPH